MKMRWLGLTAMSLVLVGASPALAASSAKRAEAMARLSFMRGVWAGPASGVTEAGKPYAVYQTERMGPMLDGDVIVVEGRGYAPDGSTAFNALGVITYEPDAKAYAFHTYAQSYSRDVPLTVTAEGWSWEAEAGPGRRTRYVASKAGGKWTEVGTLTGPNLPPQGVEIFRMTLERVGDTDWPAAGGAGANGPR